MKQKHFFQCSLCEEIFELALFPGEVDRKQTCEDLIAQEPVLISLTAIRSESLKKSKSPFISLYIHRLIFFN